MKLLGHDIFYPSLNFIARERFDPLIHLLLDFFDLAHSYALYTGIQLVLFLFGMNFLLGLFDTSRRTQLFGAASSTLVLLLLVGIDSFLLRIHWFPWLLALLVLLATNASWLTAAAAGVVAVLWIASAGSLSVLGIILAASIACYLAPSRVSIMTVLEQRRNLPYLCLTFLSLVVSFVLLPQYPMPLYPGGARLVLESTLSAVPPPLLGPFLSPSPVRLSEFENTSKLYGFHLLLLAVGVAVVLFVGLWKREQLDLRSFRNSGFLLLAAAVVVTGHLFLPIELAPFFLLSSIVPGVALAGLPWSLLSFIPVLLALTLIPRNSVCVAMAFTAVSGVLLLESLMSNRHLASPLISSSSLARDKAFLATSATDVFGDWILNPEIATERQYANMRRLQKGVDFELLATANVHPDKVALATDGNVFTRWSSGGTQEVENFFKIQFDRPVAVVRIVLSVKDNPREYPRGIRVVAGVSGADKILIEHLPWHGPVKWTSDGFPYFGPHQEVVLDFAKQQEVEFLRFEQLASKEAIPWSINEIKLYSLDEEKSQLK